MKRIAILGVAAIAVLAAPPPRPWLIWNATASAPTGLYRLASRDPLKRGDLVVVQPPPALARWLDLRGYAPLGVPLIKHIAALPPSTVCRTGATVAVDGQPIGLALPRGRRGELLPRWSGCARLGEGEVFLLNSAPGSLDSRYFGPVPRSAILGLAAPLWVERRY
ncbi:S26 family signal peptidase [Caulobacter sp. KR2-114]|uniref:S26 family signal peptidase n=1 Tax=Caulobacter sp. KR2-114 TaxID=3400912 RepID=UPI003BFDF173